MEFIGMSSKKGATQNLTNFTNTRLFLPVPKKTVQGSRFSVPSFGLDTSRQITTFSCVNGYAHSAWGAASEIKNATNSTN
jgi:hypothetical protein